MEFENIFLISVRIAENRFRFRNQIIARIRESLYFRQRRARVESSLLIRYESNQFPWHYYHQSYSRGRATTCDRRMEKNPALLLRRRGVISGRISRTFDGGGNLRNSSGKLFENRERRYRSRGPRVRRALIIASNLIGRYAPSSPM